MAYAHSSSFFLLVRLLAWYSTNNARTVLSSLLSLPCYTAQLFCLSTTLSTIFTLRIFLYASDRISHYIKQHKHCSSLYFNVSIFRYQTERKTFWLMWRILNWFSLKYVIHGLQFGNFNFQTFKISHIVRSPAFLDEVWTHTSQDYFKLSWLGESNY
jgi:hypothetical protein